MDEMKVSHGSSTADDGSTTAAGTGVASQHFGAEVTVPSGDDLIVDMTHRADLPEGEYPFGGTSVALHRKVATAYGLKDQVVVTYEIQLPTGSFPLVQRYLASAASNSHFGRLVQAMTGRPVTKRFNCGGLTGWSGMLRVVNKTTAEGDVYSNVDAVWDCVRNSSHGSDGTW